MLKPEAAFTATRADTYTATYTLRAEVPHAMKPESARSLTAVADVARLADLADLADPADPADLAELAEPMVTVARW
ncbi:hypothetical protein [Actinospica robiniae]|uniref:hypothetical protein n=1 Tax=Actinospica robiniae TaxID=304901 RepID=UPI0005509851|nr:hypothetical protein [Actinospica robiniae]